MGKAMQVSNIIIFHYSCVGDVTTISLLFIITGFTYKKKPPITITRNTAAIPYLLTVSINSVQLNRTEQCICT